MKFPKAIYLGGTPMVGKSTVARLLASRLQHECVSTDDIGAAITAVTDVTTHPQFHYMGTRDYRDYYAGTSMQDLIRDIDEQHAALWPALRILFWEESVVYDVALVPFAVQRALSVGTGSALDGMSHKVPRWLCL